VTRRVSFAFGGGGTWQFYERDGAKVPLEEIKQVATRIEAEEGYIAKIDFIEAVRAKLQAAERGELMPPDDVKTRMTRASGIDELRWRIDHKQWRLYYCEPVRLHQKRIMLGLRFSQKTTADLQDRDIDEAVVRYNWWMRDDTR
jgi:hypothetical protein